MTLEPLPGDFYNFQGLLTREEKDIVARVRTFFQEKVAPIANDAWAAAEFQFDLIPGFAALDIVKLSHEGARSLLTGWISMEMSRVDPSHSTFFGVHSGLATGTVRSFGSDEMLERLLPAMMRMQKIGAFALTEPEGVRMFRRECAPSPGARGTIGSSMARSAGSAMRPLPILS
jgi:glutaryl-CoA dehydrogenase